MDGNFENIILEELIKNQRNSVPIKYKLSNNDMKRLIKKLYKSIFDNELFIESIICLSTFWLKDDTLMYPILFSSLALTAFNCMIALVIKI